MLVDGGLSTFKILSKSEKDVEMEVVDGGKMTSRWLFRQCLSQNAPLGGPYWDLRDPG